MKKKTIFAVIMAATVTMSVMVGCAKKDTSGGSSNSSTPPQSSSAPSSAPEKVKSGRLKEVHDAILEVYGEDYPVTMPIDETMLDEMYGIKKELVKESIAEMPMMNVNVDTFIGIEAVEGKAEEVEKALNAYREKFIAEKEEFPYLVEHLPKAKASQVIRIDDYVFYVMLGTAGDNVDAENLQEIIDEQVNKGVNVIKETLKK